MTDRINFEYKYLPHPIEVYDLDEEMNRVFYDFLDRFYSAPSIRYQAICEKLFEGFAIEVSNYLDRRYSSGSSDIFTKQNYLFNNLTIVSSTYEFQNLYIDSQLFWKNIYGIVTNWEKTRNAHVHKGSIFFFWSAAALLNGELDKGFFLIHEAFREDKIISGNEHPGTPAEKTARLNYKDPANFLYRYVLSLWEFIDSEIDKYNKDNSRNISKEDIFLKFTSNPPSDDVLFSFTHSIAKFDELLMLEPEIINSNFAGLHELNLLFDLVLVIDKLIYSRVPLPKNQSEWGFFRIAKKLMLDCQMENIEETCNQNLSSVNSSQTLDFDKTIIELLNRTFAFPVSNNITPLYRDICICYCIRNHSAHNISLTTTISNQFKEIAQSVMNVLFLCIETY
jgi:hypothetical protein